MSAGAGQSAAPSKRPEAARETITVERSKPFRLLVRAGFLARALTYGVIGGVAVALALGAGASARSTNQQGALSLIAHAPLGRVVVAISALGLLGYALWKLSLAILGRGPEGAQGRKPFDRVANLGGAAVYAGFFLVAARVLLGDSGDQSAQQRRDAAGVLGWPGGRVLVAVAGIALVAISGHQAFSAWRGDFARENKTGQMSPGERDTFLIIGRVGLTARAIVFALVGYFLVRTAIDFKPSKGLGLDGTLAQVHAQPFGSVLLALAAAGLLIFAGFSVFEARYRRL
jgi:hypothetical protein